MQVCGGKSIWPLWIQQHFCRFVPMPSLDSLKGINEERLTWLKKQRYFCCSVLRSIVDARRINPWFLHGHLYRTDSVLVSPATIACLPLQNGLTGSLPRGEFDIPFGWMWRHGEQKIAWKQLRLTRRTHARRSDVIALGEYDSKDKSTTDNLKSRLALLTRLILRWMLF